MKKIITIISIVLVFLALMLGVYLKIKSTSISSNANNSVGSIEKLKENTDFQAATSFFKSGDNKSAYSTYEKMIAVEKDSKVKQVLELYSASALNAEDPKSAAAYYAKIAANQNYSDMNRAFAMLKLRLSAVGYMDQTLLYPLFTDQSEVKDKNMAEIGYIVDKKIYAIFPFMRPAIDMANYELNMNDSSSTAKMLYDKYINNPNNFSIEQMLQEEGLRNIVPNTLLAKAKFLSRIEKYGFLIPEETAKTYEDALKYVNLYGATDTKAYILLYYADYLAAKGEMSAAKVNTLLSYVNTSNKYIVAFLKNSALSKEKLPNLANSKDAKVVAFFSQFGW